VEDSRSDGGWLPKLGSEIFRAAAVDMAGRAISAGFLATLALIGLLVWQGGSVPAWSACAVVFFVLTIGVIAGRRAARHEKALRREVGRHNEYSRHLQNSLDALQRVISGDVDAEIPFFLIRPCSSRHRGS
jgi:hypothetical protein